MILSLGYARKSPDDKEGTDVSISNQIKLIEEICNNKDWKLVDIYIDKNISGSDRERKAFTNMLKKAIELCKNKDDEIIIVTKDQDRFARDTAYFSDTLQDLDAYGIKVFSVLKNNFLSYTDLGDMVGSLVDSNDIIKSRLKTQSLFEQKRREGMPPFIAPFGYNNDKKTKNWTINKKEAKIILDICDDYINNINFKVILKKYKIAKSLYYRIIKNVVKGIYNGYIIYEKKYRDSNKRIIRTEEIKYKGNFESIISEELFLKCQEKIHLKNK